MVFLLELVFDILGGLVWLGKLFNVWLICLWILFVVVFMFCDNLNLIVILEWLLCDVEVIFFMFFMFEILFFSNCVICVLIIFVDVFV